ncbi:MULTISPECIES: ROK family protein [Brucella]|uniref:ROK family protein n=1 Tax=Brucella anthropi (strain ATCC 49188 / DSM 6882 / CCUG 24695 / JCM 21032 / LMG 3331 / NBRC 15819 / NCTC 12168 / Alc 37) TaxID=439375 RepID=A6X1U5_BRUA4|nr:ROK family protein [Brucella anthropi]ABS15199.1 ROK family protein [Brucella anthropi ATCC 49188]KAB2759619.1 ROK family protein [Brucella anthropi]KAB2777050.1 ROK family protein [Brucella anthropi]MDH0366915.1 ROK family protein [Brucella anthropi]QQC24110.1 ROK family protein [Brucella anthropi]
MTSKSDGQSEDERANTPATVQGGSLAVTLGKNPERIRDHNRRVVLDVVRRHGPLGRMHIARLTHLTAQAIANIVDELVSENLLMQLGRLKKGRGQPPIQFAVNPEGAMTIGVEMGSTHMVTTVLDLSGKPRTQHVRPIQDVSPERLSTQLRKEVDAVKTSFPARLLGIGVVMPGPFDIEGMSSVGPTTLPGWSGIDAAAVLSEACGESVLVENDANAAAVGERLFGAGHAISNFAMIYFGAGIGLGMIQDGAPFRGAFGNAGEIGHIVITPNGRSCACGQKGCLETYASLHTLREKLHAAGIEDTDFDALEKLHGNRNPVLMGWVQEAADHLAPMIAMIENILDPETIILGGMLPDAIIDDLIWHMGGLPISVASRRARALPRVIRGQTGQFTAALGAASLPMFEAMTPKLDTNSEI